MNSLTSKKTYFYDLPENQIAQTPVEPRDCSRLLVYNRKSKKVEHKIFRDIIDYLQSGDVLVINNSRVIPARLLGIKEETGANIEILLQKRKNLTTWEVVAKPFKRLKEGTIVKFSDELSLKVLKKRDYGDCDVEFLFDGVFEDILNKVGSMPLPHYIKEKLKNKERYQTVYSKTEGSSAAPTAGLHWTSELLEKAKQKGVIIAEVMLHVGLGTFRPVKEDDILKHDMHSEYYEITQEVADIINKA
ncbi:MAG: S-adenosylmethionine:tRNA ribosyltransferase-isomerase, partial [Clostridia bacterium]|nr:S-adenosylmethionine:tRNA ribosyltransferase-isomerase [Clostridia bacterium]